MEAVNSSETLVSICQITRCNNPEHNSLPTRRENLKPCLYSDSLNVAPDNIESRGTELFRLDFIFILIENTNRNKRIDETTEFRFLW
jgi:hypothetical protein